MRCWRMRGFASILCGRPPGVLEALRRGKKIEAIKEYRAATGAGLKDAKEYVEELQRRAAPRVASKEKR